MRKNAEHDLILLHRTSARKLARRLMKQWSAALESDEVDSLADLALCEAAKGFNPRRNTKFTTYLFYFIRGALIRAIKESSEQAQAYDFGESMEALSSQEGEEMPSLDSTYDKSHSCPERETYRQEIVGLCNQALAKLSKLEQRVVFEVNIAEVKVAALARKLGFSRGYLSEVKTAAHRKLRPELVHLKEAA